MERGLGGGEAVGFLPCNVRAYFKSMLFSLAHTKTLNLGRNVVFRSKLTFPISFKQSTSFSIPI